jgi:hypothetical protein
VIGPAARIEPGHSSEATDIRSMVRFATEIKDHQQNREAANHDYCEADRPSCARLPSAIDPID